MLGCGLRLFFFTGPAIGDSSHSEGDTVDDSEMVLAAGSWVLEA
jgi:hypothetical protein